MSKGKITYVKGNVCEPQRLNENEAVVIPHCCNNLGVMGKGVALGLKQKWPVIAHEYMDIAQTRDTDGLKNWLGEVIFEPVEYDPFTAVANIIGQDGLVGLDNPKPVKYWALLQAMKTIPALAGMHLKPGQSLVFHCPKFGSDLAGGKWELIEELIKETWCEMGYDVVVYEFEMDKKKWGPIEDDFFEEDKLDGNWTAELKPIPLPLDVTADDYASLSVGEQLWLLKTRFSLDEKEARKIRTDDIYGLPCPLASDFEGFEESKYPVI